jgi:Peptidase family M28
MFFTSAVFLRMKTQSYIVSSVDSRTLSMQAFPFRFSKAPLSATLLGFVLLFVIAGATTGGAQILDFKATGAPVKAAPADKEIVQAVRSVSTERIHQTIRRLVDFKYRSTVSSVEAGLPPGTGILAAAQWIEQQFQSISASCGGCLEVKEDAFIEQPQKEGFNGSLPRIVKPTKIVNVYAILKGTDPAQSKRMYLVTGHYDTRVSDVMDAHSFAPGANDDSSGTATSLECARILSQHRFPATLVFAAVAGEEQGLNGSHHLAVLARQEGWNLEGVLNNDIVGGDTTPGDKHADKSLVRVFSEGVPASATQEQVRRILALGGESDSPSRELAREVLDVARTYFPMNGAKPGLPPLTPVMVLRLDRYLRGGDHRSFNEQGFPAVRFTEWRENFNHQHQNVRLENGVQFGDLIQFDDFSYIAKVARLNAATLATLASAPGMPKNVRMSTHNLDNNSVLKWEKPDGVPEGASYQIVWRETNASDWQYAGRASTFNETVSGAEHTVTVPISKDNVFFGVRSCDAKAHCGPAAIPVPER